jgi:hypothetical protein
MDILTIASVVLAPACASASPAASQRAAIVQEDEIRCAALEAAVDSLVPRRPGQRLALTDSTYPVRQSSVVTSYWNRLASVPGLDSTTWRSFVAQNQGRRPICAALPSGASLVFASDRVRRGLARDNPGDYWRAFYARFPETRGLTSVSGIGLSADVSQALLTLSHACGGLCGHHHIVLLERTSNGRWRIRYALLTMVS